MSPRRCWSRAPSSAGTVLSPRKTAAQGRGKAGALRLENARALRFILMGISEKDRDHDPRSARTRAKLARHGRPQADTSAPPPLALAALLCGRRPGIVTSTAEGAARPRRFRAATGCPLATVYNTLKAFLRRGPDAGGDRPRKPQFISGTRMDGSPAFPLSRTSGRLTDAPAAQLQINALPEVPRGLPRIRQARRGDPPAQEGLTPHRVLQDPA